MSRHRHHERRLKSQKYVQPPAPQFHDVPGQALDALNAWGYLEDCKELNPARIQCFGPGVFRGYLPMTWAGVCLWYKARGYYHYGTLYLLGIWAMQARDEAITIALGIRELTYRLPHYNAEAYYFRIQREFKTFYGDSGTPPPESACFYNASYDPAQRLNIRRELQEALADWTQEHNA